MYSIIGSEYYYSFKCTALFYSQSSNCSILNDAILSVWYTYIWSYLSFVKCAAKLQSILWYMYNRNRNKSQLEIRLCPSLIQREWVSPVMMYYKECPIHIYRAIQVSVVHFVIAYSDLYRRGRGVFTVFEILP